MRSPRALPPPHHCGEVLRVLLRIPVMDLPSSREIELETLLHQRDDQLVELTVRAANPVPNLS